MNVDYNNSWVASAGNYIHLEKDFSSAGKIDMAFSRINHTDVSGYGIIATLHFVVSVGAAGQQLNLAFSHIKIISHNEIEIPVNALIIFFSPEFMKKNLPFHFHFLQTP